MEGETPADLELNLAGRSGKVQIATATVEVCWRSSARQMPPTGVAMLDRCLTQAAAALATISVSAMVMVPVAASAQSEPDANAQYSAAEPASQYQSPPAPQYQSPPPPQGQYAPPLTANTAEYNNWLYQQTLHDYRARYALWLAETQAPPPAHWAYDCESHRSGNIAAGAIFGGVAGALLGASLAGWAARGAWALFGGSVGLTAGAAIGASATPAYCQGGYAGGGPGYYHAGPAYGPPAYYRPYPGYYYHPPAYRPAPYGSVPDPYYRY